MVTVTEADSLSADVVVMATAAPAGGGAVADVAVILLSLSLILVLARTVGWLFTKVGQPAVVGEILAGVLLGPSLLGSDISEFLFPVDQRAFLTLLANVGLILFMFVVGLELDLSLIKGKGRVAGAVSATSILLPFTLGFGLAFFLADRHNVSGQFLPFALFIGAAMSVTAFPVLARILTDRRMHRTEMGGLALACAAVDDILAWTLLAVVVGIAGGASGGNAWLVALAAPFALAMIFLVRPQLGRLTAAYERAGRLTPGILAIVLIGILLSSAATEILHVHFIFGAFLFGAIIPRTEASAMRHEILVRLEQVSVLLLLPVFFLVSGLNVDLRGLTGERLLETVAVLIVAVTGKFVGAYVGARLTGVIPWRARALGVLMNTRGLTELVILNIGLQVGLLGPELFSMLVVMALVTTMMTGPLLKRIYPEQRVARDVAAAERAAMGLDSPGYRVLLAVENPAWATERFEVALGLLQGESPAEVVVSSVQPFRTSRLEVGSGLTDELAAMTQSMTELELLVRRGSGVGIKVTILTRFSSDVAADMVAQVEALAPEVVVVGEFDTSTQPLLASADAVVAVLSESAGARFVPGLTSAVEVAWSPGMDDDTAVLAGARLARHAGVPLRIAARSGRRRAESIADGLRRFGVDVVLANGDALADGASVAHEPAQTAPDVAVGVGAHVDAGAVPDPLAQQAGAESVTGGSAPAATAVTDDGLPASVFRVGATGADMTMRARPHAEPIDWARGKLFGADD